MSDFTDYTAAVMNAEGTDLETVDLRTIGTDRLHALRHEAGVAADNEMVTIIDAILADEVLESNADEGSYDGGDD